jgi:hypothetical protein
VAYIYPAGLTSADFADGNTSPGWQPQNFIYGGDVVIPSSGTVTLLGSRCATIYGSVDYKLGLYTSAGVLVGQGTITGVSGGGYAWRDTGALSLSVTAGTYYVLVSASSSDATYQYDTAGNGSFATEAYATAMQSTETITAGGDTGKLYGVRVDFTADAAVSLDQEGFAFGSDDGSESAHTLNTQDTNLTAALGTKTLRMLVNATSDPTAIAYTLRSQKNGSGGYVAVPVGAGNAEAFSQPTWGAVGTAASGTTSCTPAYPTGISAATSHLFCFVTGRSNTASTAPTMPAGWTSVGSLEGGTGTWGVDTGTRRVHVFRKDTTVGDETGTVTVSLSGTTANTLRASIHRFEVPSGYLCELEFVSGEDTSNDTSYSATASADATFDSDRLLVTVTAQNIDTGTATSRAVSASGITFGALTNRADTAVTNGNDHRHIVNTIPVSSGSGTVAPTYSYTISDSGSGPTGFMVLRGRLPAATNEVYIAASSNVAAGGEATTARLTAPSGKTTADFATGRRWDDENGTDTLDITSGDYTEVEWVLTTQAPATTDDYFDFRVYQDGSALDTYTVTPRWTIDAVAAITIDAGGSLTYKPAALGSDNKLYLTTSGAIAAKTAPGAGDRRISLSGGNWLAN